MKERPILFCGEMVRAILDGRKTQTRRIVKPQPDFAAQPHWLFGPGHSGVGWYCGEAEYPDEGSHFYGCPYGVLGDRLWVRETWCPLERCDWVGSKREDNVNYRADCPPESETIRGEMGYAWRSPIFMPRWASRITLEIIDVRVQRVQEITFDDCVAEGIVRLPGADAEYRRLWNSINLKRGFGWEKNPWVWAITFKGAKA
jgi:hypothetical protein